ncbi:PKD domain-containing protein [Mucilaginibacter sp. FT3.2]|uniref:PKD domain-containing protein n=1 Tax=Mucilaginibacter sp. FT3.2 TaxID=2723090 RepID=UPI001617C2D3|nr:PKD domain-containing protein [Mucilaginibacter sp. FT3.2]MBB6235286.1 hypothetical protein [Mucilaginibacter sp. FT3.2]
MKKTFPAFLFFCIIISTQLSLAQGNVVSVDKTTGAAYVNIPLYTVAVGHVSLPVGVQYSAKGVRPTDVEGSAGVGWNISAGGAVTRQVRGLPDDISTDNSSAGRLGWLNNTNGTKINSLTLANTGGTPVQANVQTDVNSISSNFGDLSDTEPDIFNVSGPGLSLQFVFGNDHAIRTIPYQDVKITYTSTSAGITSFTVTNDQGTSYIFSALEVAIKKATGTSPLWFDTDFKQYQNGITYTSAWDLTQIKDIYNNAININYRAGTKKWYSNKLQVYLNGTTNATDLYTASGNNIPLLISTITSQEGNGTGSPVNAFSFNYYTNYQTGKDYIYSINGYGRLFNFSYSGITAPGGVALTRYFLTNINDNDCNTPVNYSFAYNAPQNLPDTTTLALDLWGYYNGANYNNSLRPNIYINPGNAAYERYHNMTDDNPPNLTIYPYLIRSTGVRSAISNYTGIGTLNQITYATGGYTNLVYETNDYYDSVTGYVVTGSGLRVKQITSNDGITANAVTQNYTYTDATGTSTGKPISSPKFAFTQTYTSAEADSTKWRKSTVISWRDLSVEDHSIVYGTVKEAQVGKGYTVYTNNIPVTFLDTSAPAGYPAWAPTINYTGSPTTSAIGFLTNNSNSYPFLPNINYEFERGTLASVKNYDDSNNEVSETVYTYQTPQTPVTVTGFTYAANTASEKAYGKYSIYTTATPLLIQAVTKQYDHNSTSLSQASTVNYTYGGAAHKQLTQQTGTNSDGSTITTNIKYVKDYTITSGGDGMTQALLNLQTANVNAPVESYTQVTPSGGTAKTVNASLTKFAVFTSSGYNLTLPSQQLKFVAPAGGTFTPSSVSGGTAFSYPGPYTVVGNSLAYDYSGYLQSADDGFKHISTILTDHNSFKPVATVANARYDEIAFSDFDSKLPNVNFIVEGAINYSTTSRTGKYGLSLPSNEDIYKVINKNLLAKNYIFSVWIKSAATGTLSVSITGGGTLTQTQPLTVTNTPSGWQYYEFKLPLATITTPTFEMDFWANQSIIIDDAWAYPDVAEVNTIAYDPVNFSKTAITNTNGMAAYFVNDKFGRQLYALDQDKNMLSRTSYTSTANAANFVAPVISGPSSGYHGIYYAWSIPSSMPYNVCIYDSGLSYTWDFGDGTAPFNSTAAPYNLIYHQYSANGTYTIRHTVSSSTYGSTSSTQTVTITTLPAVNISYTNTTTGSAIGTVTFKQGSNTIYTFTTAQLAAGVTITPGVYTIVIHPTGGVYTSGTGQGYKSVTFTASDDIYQCFTYTGGDFTIASADLTYEPSAGFKMSTAACTGGGQ